MRRYHLCLIILLLLLLSGCITETTSPDDSKPEKQCNVKLLPPPEGVYHCAFPDFGGTEDNVTLKRIIDFENLVGKPIVWAYFSNNWSDSIVFPKTSVQIINDHGAIPFIRMMPWSVYEYDKSIRDPVYNMQDIIDGKYDEALIKWAQNAKEANVPLIVEFGTEVNDDWFPWNERWNGSEETNQYGDQNLPDGPERFRDAYRYIIDLFREQDVTNSTWVFHVNAESWPDESWNNMSAYYPGDDYIDWIGVSVYGSLQPGEEWQTFTQILDSAYPEFSAISPEKPLAVLEFGVIENPATGDKAAWMRDALESIKNGGCPRIKAISWWHESWENEDSTISNPRLDSSPETLTAYQEEIADSFFVTDACFSCEPKDR